MPWKLNNFWCRSLTYCNSLVRNVTKCLDLPGHLASISSILSMYTYSVRFLKTKAFRIFAFTNYIWFFHATYVRSRCFWLISATASQHLVTSSLKAISQNIRLFPANCSSCPMQFLICFTSHHADLIEWFMHQHKDGSRWIDAVIIDSNSTNSTLLPIQ